MIRKEESKLKSAFQRELERQLPGFLTLHYVTTGAPDREIVGNGITTRWEMKHGTPAFKSPGNQELMMCRLALQGHARYVIWKETRFGGKCTMIVHPLEVHHRQGWDLRPESVTIDYDHVWLVEQIKQVHGV